MADVTRIRVNRQLHPVRADPAMPLLWVLRDLLGLSGTKFGCGVGLCGACTIHLDGNAERSCLIALGDVGDRAITTIEGLGTTAHGRAVKRAWIDEDVVQCGYCQPGQMMSASALLAQTPQPSDDAIDAAMTGNICRCGTYPRIRAAIHRAAGQRTP